MDREHIVYQILDKDNWEVIDVIDGFLYVYDRMPKKMKLIVDMKMTGTPNREIAKTIGISLNNVEVQLNIAKKRIIKIIF